LAGLAISAFATLDVADQENSFLDEIKKPICCYGTGKGLSERKVLYGHVFRNAMLIVIAAFRQCLSRVLWRIADPSRQSLAWMLGPFWASKSGGRTGITPILFGHGSSLGLHRLGGRYSLSDLMYVVVDRRIDFGKREAEPFMRYPAEPNGGGGGGGGPPPRLALTLPATVGRIGAFGFRDPVRNFAVR